MPETTATIYNLDTVDWMDLNYELEITNKISFTRARLNNYYAL